MVRTRDIINTYKMLVGSPEGRRTLTRENNIQLKINRTLENVVNSYVFGQGPIAGPCNTCCKAAP
jgi:hypothetical protein